MYGLSSFHAESACYLSDNETSFVDVIAVSFISMVSKTKRWTMWF